ncbi:hypothetical protein M405DRAFT_158467 [Rhizopogon salebrosus TDB-379]|nr:hypothetical protein M405DRAFT_158467 [Rhizopogon salebrosus TDB-379]
MANFPVEGAYNFVPLVESDIRSFVGILPNEDELRGMSSRGASWDLTYIGDQVGHVQFCTLSQGNGVNRTYLGVYDVKDNASVFRVGKSQVWTLERTTAGILISQSADNKTYTWSLCSPFGPVTISNGSTQTWEFKPTSD